MKSIVAIAILFFAAAVYAEWPRDISAQAHLLLSTPPAVTGSNCGVNNGPPPPAQRAGFTTLTYCADFSQPKYATLTNWMDCGQGGPFEFNEWFGYGCDTSHFQQQIDPVTGHRVMRSSWLGQSDLNNIARTNVGSMAGGGKPNTGFGEDMPAGHYIEMIVRTTFPQGFATDNLEPAPDWFMWGSCQNQNSGNSTPCPSGSFLLTVEQDVFEWFGGQNGGTAGSAGTVKWDATNWSYGYIWSGTVQSAIGAVIPGWSYDRLTTFGWLATNNGNYSDPAIQFCEYVRDGDTGTNYIIVPTGSQGGENCMTRTHGNSGGYGTADQIIGYKGGLDYQGHTITDLADSTNGRVMFGWWQGSHNLEQDMWIEQISVWSCAGWQTDNTCAANGLTQ